MGAPGPSLPAKRENTTGKTAGGKPASSADGQSAQGKEASPADKSAALSGTKAVTPAAVTPNQGRFNQMALRAKPGDAKGPAGKPPTTPKKGGAKGPAGQDEETGEAEEVIPPDPLAPQDTTELNPTRDVEIVPLRGEWMARPHLADDFASPSPAPSPVSASGNAQEGEKGKKAPPEQTQNANQRADQEAREKARQTYAELSSLAMRRQEAFVADANRVTRELRQVFEASAGEISREHDNKIAELDTASEQQCADIDSAAQNAEISLQLAYSAALTRLQTTANGAWGAINAADGKASAMIAANVKAKEDGHKKRFTTAVDTAKADAKAATDALKSWSDKRGEIYSTEEGGLLERAKNEKRQPKVEKIASAKIEEINKHHEDVIKSWTSTSDTTLCNVGCSYKGQLDGARKSTFDASRKSVGSALKRGKDSLAEQLRASLLNLRKQRQSALTQVRAQQRSAHLRLTAQANGALANARRGAQGAINAVQGAARNALPGYWRAVTGVEQSFRQAGKGGAKTILRTAQTAGAPMLSGLDNTGAQLRQRLTENKLRLERDQRNQQESLVETREPILQGTREAMLEAQTSLETQAAESLQGFNERAEELNGNISEAAQSCLKKPEVLFAESLAKSGAQADGSLDGVFSGKQPKSDETDAKGKNDAKDTLTKADDAKADGKAAPCGPCTKEGGGDGKGDGKGAKGGSGPTGIDPQLKDEKDKLKKYLDPKTEYKAQLDRLAAPVGEDLDKRLGNVHAAFTSATMRTVNEGAVTAALRGMTALQGAALDAKDVPTPINAGVALRTELADKLGADSDDYKAADLYLQGKNKEGAKAELAASQHWYNDEEERIDATMRALSPTDAAAIGADKEIYDRIHNALDGTDQKVFDALAKGDVATADALRMRDKVDEARRKGDSDAVHKAEAEYTAMRGDDYNAKQLAELDPEARKQAEDKHRQDVAAALGKIVTEEDPAKKAALDGKTDAEKQAAYTKNAVDYVTRDIVMVYDQEGGGSYEATGAKAGDPGTYTMKMEGANRDLAEAILLHGKDSPEARAAKVGIEIQRKGEDAKAENVDEAMYDQRFAPLPANATDEEKRQRNAEVAKARAERAQVLLLAAQKYAGGKEPPKDYKTDTSKSLETEPDPHVAEAQKALIAQLTAKFGDDKVGADFVTGLIKEERPSAKTASLAMQYAMYSHTGTNEELLFRYPERMTRTEIAAMRKQFKEDMAKQGVDTTLDAELGLYGKGGTFTELSGDDRLRMERAMLGVASNDREKAEAAAFAFQQQKKETGAFGRWLAEGSGADQQMKLAEKNLYDSMGVKESDFLPEGGLAEGKGSKNFDDKGQYTGPDIDKFTSATGNAQNFTQNYTAVIDSYADVATTGIAILGAVAAAVITVATGGAAGPLIAAAVIAGLASMGANYAIKGGRYGWEQAAIDLGMTAVQAITAGVGAQLGAAAQVASKGAAAASQASRMVMALSKIFTGNPVLDQIIVGAITGSISGLGTAALNEKTWEKGGLDAVGALFEGLIKGGLAGGATAAVTSSIENLSRNGKTISDRLQALSAQGGLLKGGTNMLMRGGARSLIAGLGGMAGKSTEILFDVGAGKFKGRAEDAFREIGGAGLHSAIQGFGEGAGEAVGQRIHNQKMVAAANAINEERAQRKLEPLAGDPMNPHSQIHQAAQDLIFMNNFGKNGGDGLGRALNLDHVATHAGMAPSVAVKHPDPAVQDAMRAELMRHLPESLHGQFADVPIRVLSEAEFHALTRSESGQAVTLIENGKPVVVIREGASIAHLANEGPHLLQSTEQHAGAKVAKLDESALAHWDKLDLDTQLDLYKTKIELEIDAHQRIHDALEAELARAQGRGATEQELAPLLNDLQRNEATLRNLNARNQEVSNIGPAERAAIQSGEAERPQYLDQPARLFSKESSRTSGRAGSEELDDEPYTPPTRPPEDEDNKPLFNRTPEQQTEFENRRQRGNDFNAEDTLRLAQEGKNAHSEVTLDPLEGERGRPRADAVVTSEDAAQRQIIERKHTQLAEIGPEKAIDYMNELLDIYHPGATIADTPGTRALRDEQSGMGLVRDELTGQMVLRVPEQHAPVPREVLEHAARNGIVIQDPDGRVYNLARPDGNDGVKRASARDPDEHAAAMKKALMRHVDPEHIPALIDTEIIILPKRDYARLTESENGPVVTLIRDGQPIVVIREGTPISRLAEEGPHLVQAHESRTSVQVAKLDEHQMARWHSLDLDTQLDLYQTKIALEIDAHERINESLHNELVEGKRDQAAVLRQIERNEATLRNLRARSEEVANLSPEERAAIATGSEPRPQYLEQPPRLFSKGPGEPPDAAPLTIFEPFVGPELKSPRELQERYPGARVIASEANPQHSPSAADIADFEARGGQFINERFGETLPNNSIDRMHVRFPLPHEKAAEMMMPPGLSPREQLSLAKAHRANRESITHLGPEALRSLKPAGEMEILFHESSIEAEIQRICQREWTDPVTQQRYRLEMVGEPIQVPRLQAAPFSGHGIPKDAHMATQITLRKVAIAEPDAAPPVPQSTPPADAPPIPPQHAQRAIAQAADAPEAGTAPSSKSAAGVSEAEQAQALQAVLRNTSETTPDTSPEAYASTIPAPADPALQAQIDAALPPIPPPAKLPDIDADTTGLPPDALASPGSRADESAPLGGHQSAAEAIAGPRPVEATHPPAAPEAPAPAPELTPAEKKRAERMAKAVVEVPGRIRALGLDPSVLDGASPSDMLNILNALESDPIGAATGARTRAGAWEPSEHQKQIARWALENSGGKVGDFHSLYEFAAARFSALKAAEEQALVGTRDAAAQAKLNAIKKLTPEFLADELGKGVKLIEARTPGQHLPGPTAGMSADEVAKALQVLEHINFKSPVTEVYHAWKHRKEVPPGIPGSDVIERQHTAAMATIRQGTVVLAKHAIPPDTGTRVIIHMRFGAGVGDVKEAILHVTPDGRVSLSSWGDPKAVKPSPIP